MRVFKRVAPLLLAAVLVLGVLPTAMPVYGATIINYKMNTDNFKVDRATPDPDTYDTKGIYTFEITDGTSGDDFKITLSIDGKTATNIESQCSFINNESITYGGLTFTKVSDVFKVSDKFELEITSIITTNDDAYMSSARMYRAGSGTSTYSTVKRNNTVKFEIVIVDPNVPRTSSEATGTSAATALKASAVPNTNSFDYVTTGSSSNKSSTTVEVVDPIANKLTFKVTFDYLVYTGVGNTLTFDFDYEFEGQHYRYTFSRSYNECVTYVPDVPSSSDDEDEKLTLDPLVPKIIVSSYDYGAVSVNAGDSIQLKLQFTNTSDRYDLDNVTMKIDVGEGFSITNASNSYHINSLKIGQTMTQTVDLQALATAKVQSYPIKIDFSYQYIANEKRLADTTSESISIPITQPDRFSVDELQIPATLYVNDEYPLSITFVNKGQSEVYNVTAELRGSMPNSGERQFVGNVASGTESSADFYIQFTEPGTNSGTVVISYEDSNLNVKEVVRSFVIDVMSWDYGWEDPFPGDVFVPETEEPTGIDPKTVGLSLAGVIIAAMCCYLTIMKEKTRRSELLDEDF